MQFSKRTKELTSGQARCSEELSAYDDLKVYSRIGNTNGAVQLSGAKAFSLD